MSKAAYGAGEGFSTAPTFESTEEILGDTLALHLKKCTEDSATPLPPKSLKLLPVKYDAESAAESLKLLS